MANKQFTDLTAIASVDRAADLLAIYDFDASSLKKTSTNTLLDLTSHPVGISDVQTLTNKTITTPTLTVNDNAFTIQDNSDTTKKLQLQLSGITTSTTRTLTVPDVNDTIVTLAATQTLTNKTLTSPTINTATISNPTLTTDVVAEYTGANGVTVDGLNIKDGKLNTNNSVVVANITDAAVTPAKLLAGTGSSWVWQSWTPTLVNLSGGTITSAKYTQIGKTVHLLFWYTLAGAGVSGAPTFTLPVTAAAQPSFPEAAVGRSTFIDTGTQVYYGTCFLNSTTVMGMYIFSAGSTYVVPAAISSTAPFVWGNTDQIFVTATYEAA